MIYRQLPDIGNPLSSKTGNRCKSVTLAWGRKVSYNNILWFKVYRKKIYELQVTHT